MRGRQRINFSFDGVFLTPSFDCDLSSFDCDLITFSIVFTNKNGGGGG